MQKTLNLKIKYREGFRPFAPSVLAEDASEWFELEEESPFMLFVVPVRQKHRKPLPKDYWDLPLYQRLYHNRSQVPAITHIDFSARVQTVTRDMNPRYFQVIEAFKRKTGVGMLVNTSFNIRGEPIVCTPEDAYLCFMRTEMDFLVVGDFLFPKSDQPEFDDREKARENVEWD